MLLPQLSSIFVMALLASSSVAMPQPAKGTKNLANSRTGSVGGSNTIRTQVMPPAGPRLSGVGSTKQVKKGTKAGKKKSPSTQSPRGRLGLSGAGRAPVCAGIRCPGGTTAKDRAGGSKKKRPSTGVGKGKGPKANTPGSNNGNSPGPTNNYNQGAPRNPFRYTGPQNFAPIYRGPTYTPQIIRAPVFN